MISPAYLENGDEVRIISTARKVERSFIDESVKMIESWGLKVSLGKNLFSEKNQFAGTDEERLGDLQEAMDDENVKAIFCARGGYGTLRLIDDLNFGNFKKNPKWIVGYSDITFLHGHIQKNHEIESIHATMPISYKSNSERSLENLKEVLFGKSLEYDFNSHPLNRQGSAIGEMVGGNLSVLYAMIGSISFPNTHEKILFIEDLDEYLYHVDRMMISLKRARVFEGIKALIIGGMTDMNDNEVPFGKNALEIIQECVAEYKFPIAFDFPAGHIDDNNPIILGRWAELGVDGEKCHLKFSS